MGISFVGVAGVEISFGVLGGVLCVGVSVLGEVGLSFGTCILFVPVASVEMWVGGGIGFGVAWEVAVEMTLLLHGAVAVVVNVVSDFVVLINDVELDVGNVLLPLQPSFVEVLLLVVVVDVVLSVLLVSDKDAIESDLLGLS